MKKAHSAMSPGRAEGRGDAGYQVAMHLPRRTSFPKLTQQISKWHISSIEKYWVEWPWKNSNWARNGRPCTHFAISWCGFWCKSELPPGGFENSKSKIDWIWAFPKPIACSTANQFKNSNAWRRFDGFGLLGIHGFPAKPTAIRR